MAVDTRFFPAPRSINILELAKVVEAVEIIGCSDRTVHNISTLENAVANDLSFFANKKYLPNLKSTKAGAVIVHKAYADQTPNETSKIVVDKNPLIAYAKAVSTMFVLTKTAPSSTPISKNTKFGKNCSVGHFTVIEDGVEIGDDVEIGCNTYIGVGVSIGNGCKIADNVHIECSILGEGIVINSGARIGCSGFGIINSQSKPVYIPQLGRVIVGNFVRIGANTTIDRGSLEDTVIGEATIIDNLVQIAHNVQIGKNCAIVSQVGIAGSCKIGNFVTIAGQVGLAGHLSIGDNVIIAAKSGVAKDISSGSVVGGIPAVDINIWRRQAAFLKNKISGKDL